MEPPADLQWALPSGLTVTDRSQQARHRDWASKEAGGGVGTGVGQENSRAGLGLEPGQRGLWKWTFRTKVWNTYVGVCRSSMRLTNILSTYYVPGAGKALETHPGQETRILTV